MEWILQNMKTNGFAPDTVIDIGAYKGEWTKDVRGVFPQAHFLMVEPQLQMRERLESMAGRSPHIAYANELLAAEQGKEVTFYIHGSVSSVLEKPESGDEAEKHVTTTLDQFLEETSFPDPNLIKLDVQGYELEVMRGASSLLDRSPPEAMILETSLIDCIGGAPLFLDVCQFMDERGYRVYDFCTFYRRPLDGALWQVDTVFVHENSELVATNQYQ